VFFPKATVQISRNKQIHKTYHSSSLLQEVEQLRQEKLEIDQQLRALHQNSSMNSMSSNFSTSRRNDRGYSSDMESNSRSGRGGPRGRGRGSGRGNVGGGRDGGGGGGNRYQMGNNNLQNSDISLNNFNSTTVTSSGSHVAPLNHDVNRRNGRGGNNDSRGGMRGKYTRNVPLRVEDGAGSDNASLNDRRPRRNSLSSNPAK
jgi:fragile X mental retardation protein